MSSAHNLLAPTAWKRRRDPQDPLERALWLYGLIAASGFAVGWAAHALGL